MRVFAIFVLLHLGQSWQVDERCLESRNLRLEQRGEDSGDYRLDGEAGTTLDPDLQHGKDRSASYLRGLGQGDFRFNLKLYWEEGYCWQDEWIEQRWCMECSGEECNEGDVLQIQDCENKAVQEFAWIPAAGTGGGGRLKVSSKDLCLERVSINRFELHACSETIKQVLVGFSPDEPFELRPYGNDEKCLNQHHHPKASEEIYTTACPLARLYNTNQWQVIFAQGSYGDNESGVDTPRDNKVLRDATCTRNTPCKACVGHCDGHNECEGDLKCKYRSVYNPFDATPGCIGRGRRGSNYCYKPDAPFGSDQDVIPLVRPVRRCLDTNKCAECEGDCRMDSNCKGNLVCFQKTGFAPIPGCSGPDSSRTDYCVDPSKITS